MDTRRRTYAILVGIILLTVPCYLSGIVLLSRAPPEAAHLEAENGDTLTTPLLPGFTLAMDELFAAF